MTTAGNLSVEAQARYAFIQQLVKQRHSPGECVVELGAAPGDQIAHFARLGFRAVALDIGIASDAWGGGEHGRMQRLFEEAGVQFTPWNLEETPYPLSSSMADAVVMTEVFEHLREYPITSLREVERILRPGGMLYFTTPNQAYLVNRLRLLRGKNVATPLHDWIGGLPFARHAREYTFDEVRSLVGAVGLEAVLLTSRHFNVDSGRTSRSAHVAKRLIARIARTWPTLGPMIILVARKVDDRGE